METPTGGGNGRLGPTGRQPNEDDVDGLMFEVISRQQQLLDNQRRDMVHLEKMLGQQQHMIEAITELLTDMQTTQENQRADAARLTEIIGRQQEIVAQQRGVTLPSFMPDFEEAPARRIAQLNMARPDVLDHSLTPVPGNAPEQDDQDP